ncbi:MAG: response regulator transcription factor [Desulfovibrio sp.]|jgi:DNA-binding response OmpR family regulator|nr:response regulator transcription factor [Desulfovibrio sp.]
MADGLGKFVLVIDDEERVRELLVDYLSDYDEFELAGAESAEQALELLRLRPAELCVVDMRLPGLNGTGFIEAAAAEGLCRKFLVHTGSVDFSLPKSLQLLGMCADDIFYKPANAAKVAERIRQLLRNC